MNLPQASSNSKFFYLGTVALFVVSFWSSGVFLIRALSSHNIWDSGSGTALLFLVSIPLVYVSILSVKKFLHNSKNPGDSVVYDTLAGVLILHAVALSLFPYLYAFEASSALSAAAWLLWFGGWALILSKHLSDS